MENFLGIRWFPPSSALKNYRPPSRVSEDIRPANLPRMCGNCFFIRRARGPLSNPSVFPPRSNEMVKCTFICRANMWHLLRSLLHI